MEELKDGEKAHSFLREHSAADVTSRKMADHTNRDLLSPRKLGSRHVASRPSKDRSEGHGTRSKQETEVDVAQLNSLLTKLSTLESEKNDRYERWKQEAVEHGMKMVELERKRSDEEHAILLRRIAFLSEELEETKKLLQVKTRECEEIADIAEHLSEHLEASLAAHAASPSPSAAA
eukprot:CAMPEP_0113710140 /NCGR_PEP_ID=MMETSP0038_2-20120614/29981_1 /TAXON_ID=2898 /ORGANISM="Cryptomonas paramecium" /LENGTH=176 /DNA_ID=CAMNT_0000636143 /DNA_START=83 /DNA_END=609 /DNA_ORIENTATION=+ /assembly_acc=CAM_ASM_000170